MRLSRSVVALVWRIAVVAIITASLFIIFAQKTRAVGPALISFQGKVVNADGTNVTNGAYNFDFIFWDDPTAGTNRWQELTKSITVTNGVFQTNLGSATALPDFNTYPSLYLAVRFNADAAGYMSPRVQLTSVPYALNADKLGGLAPSAFAQLGIASQTFTGLNTFTPSSTNNLIINGDNDSNLQINSTIGADVTQSGLTFTLTDNASASTGTVYGLSITNADNGANVGVPDALAYLKNANAAETIPNGLLIEQTGAGTLTNAIQVLGTAGTITNGLLIADGAGAITNGIQLTGTFTTTLLDTPSLDISGAGAITGATGVSTTTVTASSAIAANGGITFDAATDTLGAFTLAGTLDANTNIITNIGNAGTDFIATTGGLTLAGTLTVNSDVAITLPVGTVDFTVSGLDADSTVTFSGLNSCDTIDTTAAGVLTCGVDAGAGASPFSTATGLITKTAGTDQLKLTMAEAGDYGLLVDSSVAPTADLVQITNAGFGTTTTAIDGLQINFATTAVAGSVDNAGLRLVIDPIGATEAGDTVEAIDIANITNPTGLVAAIRIGTGFDTLLDSATLDISAAGAITGATGVSSTTGTFSGAVVAVGVDSGTGLIQGTGGLTVFGNVGIQVSAPTANLQVAQSTTSVGTVATNGTITLTGTGTTFTNTFKVGDTITVSGETVRTIATIASDTSLTATAAFSTTASSLTYTLVGGTRFVVKGNGNVGIGTTAPGVKLSVIGGDLIVGADEIYDRLSFSANTAASTIGGGDNRLDITTNDNAAFDIALLPGVGASVGIGTTTPSSLFSVGSSSQFQVDASGNLDALGTLTAGTGNVAVTDAAGKVQHDSIVDCADTQILKWATAGGWGCAADATGSGGAPTIKNTSDTTSQAITATEVAVATVAYAPSSTTNEIQIWANMTFDSTSTADNIVNLKIRRDACTTGTQAGITASGFSTNSTEYIGLATTGTDEPITTSSTTWVACGQGTISGGNKITANIIVMEVNRGADLAEIYNTNDPTLTAGNVVSLDPSLQSGVKKSSLAYDNNVIGIVSTSPALLIGGGDRIGITSAPIALSGRVPVKVTAENGPIKFGDLLTSSSTPGVAMRATKAGQTIGQAMSEYDGDGVGRVMAFVKTDYSNGAKLANVLPGVRGLSQDGTQLAAKDIGKLALNQFISQKEQLESSVDLSEITTDRLMAGLEVITSQVTTDNISLNTLDAATGTDIKMRLSDDGRFVVTNTAGEETITFEANGNARFVGTLTADKIKANQIEGLEILTDKISSLQDQLAKEKTAAANATLATPTANSEPTPDQTLLNEANISSSTGVSLVILAQIESRGGLIVDKDAQFNGKTIFALLAEFNGPANFNDQATFNNDAGGVVVIKNGAKKVSVSFSKEYSQTPIVVANWSFADTKDASGNVTDSSEDKQQRLLEGNFNYLIANVSVKGFDIIINDNATEDLTLNWLAVSIKDAKISQSQ